MKIIVLACVATLALTGTLAWASTPTLAEEAAGIDSGAAGPVPVPDPEAHAEALRAIPVGGLLLIPESSNDRVMAFDPITGDLIDADFIPADPDNLSTPIHAILSSSGTSILLSDQLDDVVQEYDLDGNYIGVFAPAGGANTAILDNIRGISLRPNGNLLVSVGGGANDDAIAEFDTTGTYIGNFVANGAAGLDSPFDVLEIVAGGGSLSAGDFLVGGITSDAIHHYDATGAVLANFAGMNSFPEQLAQAANGNVLVANFSGTQEGIVELNTSGGVVGTYDPASLGGYRGVYELPNGNLLCTNGSGVHEIDRSGALVATKIAGVSARFIELVKGGGGTSDLTIAKVASSSRVEPGGTLTYTITVTNQGPDDAAAVVVTDALPAALTYVSDTCGGTNTPPWTWNIGTLAAAGSPVSCDIVVTVDPAATGTIENTAVVAASGTDPTPTDNDSTFIVRIGMDVPTLGTSGAILFALLILAAGVLAFRRLT